MKRNQKDLIRIHQKLKSLDMKDWDLSDAPVVPPPGGGPREPERPMDEAYFESLHDKIMAKVAQTEIEPPVPFNTQILVLSRYWRKYSRPVARTTMSLAFVMFGIGYLMTQLTQETPLIERQSVLVKESVQRVDEFSVSVLSPQSELDFMSDVAAHSQRLDFEDFL